MKRTRRYKRKSNRKGPRNWVQQNLFQVNEKLYFYLFLKKLCEFVNDPRAGIQGPGRPGVPYADRVYAAVTKVFVGDSARRSSFDLAMAAGRGFISEVPHFNSVLNFFCDESMLLILEHLLIRSSWPLRHHERFFAIDGTGFTTDQYKRLVTVKQKAHQENWHLWQKFHICVGVDSHIITAGIPSHGTANDLPFLRPLLKTTLESGFQIMELYADKGYLSGENLLSIVSAGAVPYIPPKKNTTAQGKSSAWARMYALHDDEPEEFYEHYHQRSNVETTFSMIKKVFSAGLRAKSQLAQHNEILAKAICHNLRVLVRCKYELGLTVNFDDAPPVPSEENGQLSLLSSRFNYQPGINRVVHK